MLFKNFQNNGINIYVEDGIGAYSDSKVDDFPIRKKILLRVLFGKSFQRLRILGTYPCIHKMFAFHPEIVRDELRGLKIEKIPDNTFKLLLTSNFCHHFFKTQNIDISTLNNKIVIFIPHSSLLIKINKLEEYKKVLKQIGSTIEEIVIKYHPREKEKDYLKMSLNRKIQIFPRSVPAELLYMTFLDNKPKAIISDSYTTFINTTGLEDVKLISLMDVLQIEDNGLIKRLSNSNIIFPNDITDLFDILSKL